MLAPTPGIASSAKYTCSITKHPPSHPSMLHILRWVLYFQRFLHHIWCLLSLSTLTFSNCAWAVCVCCLLRYADTFWLDSFWPMLPDPDYVVKQITYWLSVYKFLHSCSDCVVSTSGMFYLLPYSTSGIFKLFCDFVCTTYHIKLMTEHVLETTVFHPYVGDTWHFTIWFTARRVLETVELYHDFMGS